MKISAQPRKKLITASCLFWKKARQEGKITYFKYTKLIIRNRDGQRSSVAPSAAGGSPLGVSSTPSQQSPVSAVGASLSSGSSVWSPVGTLLPTVSGLVARSVGGNQPVSIPGTRSADVTAAVGLETPLRAPVGLAMAVDTSGTSAVVLHADGNEGGASEKNAESEDVPGGSVRPKTSKRRPKN